MKKKTSIFGIILLLGLAFTPVTGAIASGDNNLVQLDIKKTNGDAVDVTFFTTNPYSDNIVVRKKSDNKYVILMPKVLTTGYSSPSLNGVKDIITNIDVKSLNDAGNGYTKVTLITTKPINIKTRAQKSIPVTDEQQEVKTLIQQANTIKSDAIKKSVQKAQTPQKTEITVNKAPAAKETKVENASKIKLTEVNPKTLEVKKEVKDLKQNKTEKITNKIKEVKLNDLSDNVPEIVPEIIPTAIVDTNNKINNLKDINDLKKTKKVSFLSKAKSKIRTIKNEVESRMPFSIPSAITFIIIPLLGLMILSKFIKASLAKSRTLKAAFIDHLAERQPVLNTVKYNNIVNNNELSWQEKYKRFLDESSRPASRGKKGHYAFITTPIPADEIEQKRRELERMVTLDSAPQQDNKTLFDDIVVHSEDDSISNELSKSTKLKGFSKPTSLKETSRHRIESRFKKYEEEIPQKEQKNIELNNSALHSNPRRSKNDSLNVTDLKGTGKNKNKGKNMKAEGQEYVMSSLDEYFSILEKEQSQAPTIERTTNPIASSLSKIKPSMLSKEASKAQDLNRSLSNPINKQSSNPISKLRNETKTDYINGLIVKSGFNIDENRGFYIVNLDGTSALVGRVKEEIFVLKKFDNNIDRPIQVRHDNNNVYMVKAEGFKSLVEVGEEKMGVLIEL